MSFAISNVCAAFDSSGVGTRVLNEAALLAVLEGALEEYDTSKDRSPGQHWIVLPEKAWGLVSCGDGKIPPKDVDPDPFIIREWRGEQMELLPRKYAAPVTGLAVAVYTADAYCSDPDPSLTEEERHRIRSTGVGHVIVGVFASGGPPNRVTLKSGRTLGVCSPSRLEANLAGANPEYLGMTEDEKAEARTVCKARWEKWRTVSD